MANVIGGIIEDKEVIKKNVTSDNVYRQLMNYPVGGELFNFKTETVIVKNVDLTGVFLWGDTNSIGIRWGDIPSHGFVWTASSSKPAATVQRVVNEDKLWYTTGTYTDWALDGSGNIIVYKNNNGVHNCLVSWDSGSSPTVLVGNNGTTGTSVVNGVLCTFPDASVASTNVLSLKVTGTYNWMCVQYNL